RHPSPRCVGGGPARRSRAGCSVHPVLACGVLFVPALGLLPAGGGELRWGGPAPAPPVDRARMTACNAEVRDAPSHGSTVRRVLGGADRQSGTYSRPASGRMSSAAASSPLPATPSLA